MEHGDALRAWIALHLTSFDVRAIDDPEARRAAVAVTLAPDRQQRACFLLTRRAASLRHHGGQWALPGGRVDPGESCEQAALRELQEELGVELEPDQVLGRLDDYATRSGFSITPVVTWCNDYQCMELNAEEVAHAFRVPLADLDRDDVPVLSRIPQSDRPVLSMPILGGLVHSPTAAIVYQLLEVALRGRGTRVAHYEQPVFAWR